MAVAKASTGGQMPALDQVRVDLTWVLEPLGTYPDFLLHPDPMR